jgi:hypothetical protein
MRKPANIPASVRARLLNLSRVRNEPFQLLLTRYVLERLLYRLSLTAHRDRLIRECISSDPRFGPSRLRQAGTRGDARRVLRRLPCRG